MEKFPEKVSVAVFATAVMPSTTTPLSSIIEEFYKGHPLEAYMDSEVMISTDPNNPSSFLHLGPKYMSSRMYQLSAPEDFMLATMLVRPGNLFLDRITKEVKITEENFGSLSRAYIIYNGEGGESEQDAGTFDSHLPAVGKEQEDEEEDDEEDQT
ncbi:salicylic acid-binding protein 2-like [Elaeis guineensis]|uniref:salicylic acid-binding protein 2-like n=1 Tax=Elaeis guineensis var. tenera TaxID=51953 RepID=UPI003C6D997D